PSPSDCIPASFALGPLERQISRDHIFHSHAHRLIHGNLIVAAATRLSTKSDGSQSRPRRDAQARKFAAPNRSWLKSIERLDKQVMGPRQVLRQFSIRSE